MRKIAAAFPGMSAQDQSLSSMEGMTGTAQPAPDLTSGAAVMANRTDTIMGNSHHSTNVHTRHLTRLLGLLNAGLPAGTTPFVLRTGNRPAR